jgi:aryl-alcohol dehydrogenase-like predicted oxidoreductase
VHPISAMQVEYSPWSLDIEGPESTNLLQACRELGVAVVAYSPVGRGFLTGEIKSPDDFGPTDLRRRVPRFSKENFPKNLVLVDRMKELAAKKGCTPGQLAIAWLMAQGDDIIPIPGTRRLKYLEENVGAVRVKVTSEENAEIRRYIDDCGVAGEKMSTGPVIDFGDTPPLKTI